MSKAPYLAGIRLREGARPVACVDVGGTKISVCVGDSQGLRGKFTEPTAKSGDPDQVARQIIRMVAQSCAAIELELGAISALGVASCGPFVLRDGYVELAAPNICGGAAWPSRNLPNDWITAPLEAPLLRTFPQVRVENDGIAALIAEQRWGALQGQDHCAYVTWSTGIGVGLCVDGRVLRGKNGNAGHAGHMFVTDNADALCGCGNFGDVEGLIAGDALTRRFDAAGYTDAAKLFEAAYAGDIKAKTIVDDLCKVMGRALYNLVVTLDLQRISLGGSVFWHNREYLLPRLRARTVQNNSYSGSASPIQTGAAPCKARPIHHRSVFTRTPRYKPNPPKPTTPATPSAPCCTARLPNTSRLGWSW